MERSPLAREDWMSHGSLEGGPGAVSFDFSSHKTAAYGSKAHGGGRGADHHARRTRAMGESALASGMLCRPIEKPCPRYSRGEEGACDARGANVKHKRGKGRDLAAVARASRMGG